MAKQKYPLNFEAFITACVFDVPLGKKYMAYRANDLSVGELKEAMIDIASKMQLQNTNKLIQFIKDWDEADLQKTADTLSRMAGVTNGVSTGIGP